MLKLAIAAHTMLAWCYNTCMCAHVQLAADRSARPQDKPGLHLVFQDQLAVGCYDGVVSHWQLQQLAVECLQLDWTSSQGCEQAVGAEAAAQAVTMRATHTQDVACQVTMALDMLPTCWIVLRTNSERAPSTPPAGDHCRPIALQQFCVMLC
jgi:hypothetical protein